MSPNNTPLKGSNLEREMDRELEHIKDSLRELRFALKETFDGVKTDLKSVDARVTKDEIRLTRHEVVIGMITAGAAIMAGTFISHLFKGGG